MKKVFLSMMLAGALVAGNQAFAQSPTDGKSGATTQTQQCQNCPQGEKAGKGGKAAKGQKGKKAQKGNKPEFNPFDGIQLTPDQQQKLQVLREGLGPVVLTPQQQKNIPQNPNLTPEQKKQLKAEKKAKKLEAKKNYLNGVKETLTPDQYVIFLENCYLYAPSNPGKAAMKQARHKDGKHGKKGHHGEKGKKKQNETTSANQ